MQEIRGRVLAALLLLLELETCKTDYIYKKVMRLTRCCFCLLWLLCDVPSNERRTVESTLQAAYLVDEANDITKEMRSEEKNWRSETVRGVLFFS